MKKSKQAHPDTKRFAETVDPSHAWVIDSRDLSAHKSVKNVCFCDSDLSHVTTVQLSLPPFTSQAISKSCLCPSHCHIIRIVIVPQYLKEEWYFPEWKIWCFEQTENVVAWQQKHPLLRRHQDPLPPRSNNYAFIMSRNTPTHTKNNCTEGPLILIGSSWIANDCPQISSLRNAPLITPWTTIRNPKEPLFLPSSVYME